MALLLPSGSYNGFEHGSSLFSDPHVLDTRLYYATPSCRTLPKNRDSPGNRPPALEILNSQVWD